MARTVLKKRTNDALILSYDEGDVIIRPLPDGRRRVTVEARTPDAFIPRATVDTDLSDAVIELFAEDDPLWTPDILNRYDAEGEEAQILQKQLGAYLARADVEGKRILDFGCGAGASTVIMAKMYPGTTFIGVELDEKRIQVAKRIAQERGLTNIEFLTSPSGDTLPESVMASQCDEIMMCAVYEHLLPNERRVVMPLLWKALRPGGYLFMNQTPHSWFPYEHHSTGLWGINYVPDRVAHWMARTFGKMNKTISRSDDWQVHLRSGIRGGSERAVLENLAHEPDVPHIAQPRFHARDRADFWLKSTSPRRRTLKAIIAWFFRLTDKLFGVVPTLNMDLVLQKKK